MDAPRVCVCVWVRVMWRHLCVCVWGSGLVQRLRAQAEHQMCVCVCYVWGSGLVQSLHPESGGVCVGGSHVDVPLSQHQGLFKWVSSLHQVAKLLEKYRSFSFSISPSNEYSGLISFRMDWLDILGIQGTLKSLLQHHSSKELILRHSAFFTVQL